MFRCKYEYVFYYPEDRKMRTPSAPDDRAFAFNLALFKNFRYYDLFNPNSERIFGRNVYHVTIVTFTAMLQLVNVYGFSGLFTGTELLDDHRMAMFQFTFAQLHNFMSVSTLIIFTCNADKIWDLLDMTRDGFVTSRKCRERIGVLRECRGRSIRITNFFGCFIMSVLCAWCLYPLHSILFLDETDRTDRAKYENIFNLLYAVTVRTYNKYFYLFYGIELWMVCSVVYFFILRDVTMISFTCVIAAQYEIHALAYENIDIDRRRSSPTTGG